MKKLVLFITATLFLSFLFCSTFAQQSILWSENFEGDWTADWHADAGTWEAGIPTSGPGSAFNGTNCAATVLSGNYSDNVVSRLIRHSSFVVPSVSVNPRLRFWHWYSFSGDHGKVQIKVDGTENWVDISSTYNDTGGNIWTYPSIDLSDFAGLSVQIAFYFYSGSFNTSTGWYIDDIEVITGPMVFNNPEDWENGLGDWAPERGTWEVGIPSSGPGSAYTGEQCVATVLDGNYSDNVSSRLISPTYIVPSASENPRLRFWHWYSFSGDHGKVQIKVDGTENWVDISSTYNDTGGNIWTYPSIDLSDFAGLSVQIAFYFYSGSFNTSTGWYIDDIEVITGPIVFNNPEDWENGLGDWAPERGTWEVGIPSSGPGSAYTGEQCVATVLDGNYSDNVSSRLISPTYIVPSASENPRLRFWHWYSFSGDHGKVQIKVDGTEDWVDISSAYYENSSGNIWTYTYFSLSDYAGQSVQIAFYFYSSSFNTSTGWYIDDIRIGDNSNLIVDAGPEKNTSSSSSATLNASASGGTQPYSYQWAPTDGLDDPNILNPLASPSESTTYTLSVTDNNGCFRTDRVTVNVIQSDETDILSFSIGTPPQIGDPIIDPVTNTVKVVVEEGTDLTDIVSTFSISAGATATVGGIPQESGVSSNDFTNPVTYVITAEDGQTVQNWLVTIAEPTTIIERNIKQGWTWFSINVEGPVMSIGTVLGNLSLEDDDYIKNQTVSSTYYESFGWFGELASLDPREMYKMKKAHADILNFEGSPADPCTPIPIQTGWNWIGYLPQTALPIDEALASINPLEGDYIKSQELSATYYDAFGWFGELTHLEPLEGYMLKTSHSETLIYPGCEIEGDFNR